MILTILLVGQEYEFNFGKYRYKKHYCSCVILCLGELGIGSIAAGNRRARIAFFGANAGKKYASGGQYIHR